MNRFDPKYELDHEHFTVGRQHSLPTNKTCTQQLTGKHLEITDHYSILHCFNVLVLFQELKEIWILEKFKEQ